MPRGAQYSFVHGYMSRLPSPRKVSSAVFKSKNETDGDKTHMFMLYGQFVDHDVTRTTKDGEDTGRYGLRQMGSGS